jgi:hypothetical protein
MSYVSRLHGCMAVRTNGCLAAWLHGCMDARLYGCMAAWVLEPLSCHERSWRALGQSPERVGLHGCMAAWLYGCMAAWVLEPHACHERSWCALGQSPERVGLRLGLGHREERVLERIKVSKYGPIHVVRVFPETPDLVWIVTATARASTLNELDAA